MFMRKLMKKRVGAVLKMETVIYIVVIAALSAMAIFGGVWLYGKVKYVQADWMASDIAAACTAYESDMKKGLPDNLGELLTTSNDSIDGNTKGPWLKRSGWSSEADILTPWNETFTYSKTNRSVTYTPGGASSGANAVTKDF